MHLIIAKLINLSGSTMNSAEKVLNSQTILSTIDTQFSNGLGGTIQHFRLIFLPKLYDYFA